MKKLDSVVEAAARPLLLGATAVADMVTRRRVAGATFNLFNTILGGGGGIVPLPRCVRLVGLKVAPGLLVSSAILSAYSACAVVAASVAVRESTYQGVAHRTIGRRGATLVQVLIVSLTFGISVAVIDIFADVAPSMLQLSRTTTVLLAGSIVTPIVALVRRIDKLACISACASALVAAFVIFVFVHFSSGHRSSEQALHSSPSMADVREAMSIVNLSFLCHFNLLPLFRGLPGAPAVAARRSMYGVIVIATLLSLLVYASVGILGFIAFGEATSGNAFADYAAAGGRAALWLNYAITTAQLLSLPLLVHEGVRELVGLIGVRRVAPTAAEQHTLLRSAGRDGSDDEHVALGEAHRGAKASNERLCAVVWCACATCIAVFAADTSKVLAVIAALCGAPLMSVLPIVMLLRSNHGMGGRALVLNCALLMLGIGISTACAVDAVRGLLR